MKGWGRTRSELQELRLRCESGRFNADGILTERHRIKLELSIRGGAGSQLVARVAGLQRDLGIAKGVVLRIVDNSTNRTKDGGRTIRGNHQYHGNEQRKWANCKSFNLTASHRGPLDGLIG